MEELVYSEKKIKKSITINTSDGIWIGDPCYVLGPDLYDKVCCNGKWMNCELGEDDKPSFGLLHGTTNGDGIYDGVAYGYCVDAGVLAIIDGKYVKDDNGPFGPSGFWVEDIEDGEHTITLEYEAGVFDFYVDGDFVESVDTDPEDEEDEEDEEEDW